MRFFFVQDFVGLQLWIVFIWTLTRVTCTVQCNNRDIDLLIVIYIFLSLFF